MLSGRFALVEKSREFTLVPWRPVLERQLGKQAGGIMRTDGISWRIGRGRSGPEISKSPIQKYIKHSSILRCGE